MVGRCGSGVALAAWSLAATSLAASSLAATPAASAAHAPDVAYRLVIDGRPIDRHGASALNRGGTTYVDVVRIVKSLDGLLSFEPARVVRVTLGGRTIDFTLGARVARLEGTSLALPGPAFRRGGDTFVPLATLARLAGAKLTIDAGARQASLALGGGDAFPAAQPEASPGASEDVAPSPLQALHFTTTATSDGATLHCRVDITNVTAKPYALDFPTAAQIAFVLARNGSEIWTSAPAQAAQMLTSLSLAPHASTSVTADDAGFGALGSGRYTVRVRLLTQPPLDLAPVSVTTGTPATR